MAGMEEFAKVVCPVGLKMSSIKLKVLVKQDDCLASQLNTADFIALFTSIKTVKMTTVFV